MSQVSTYTHSRHSVLYSTVLYCTVLYYYYYRHDLKECDSRINELTIDLHTTTKNSDCLQIMTTDLQQQYDSMKLKLEEQILQYKVIIVALISYSILLYGCILPLRIL